MAESQAEFEGLNPDYRTLVAMVRRQGDSIERLTKATLALEAQIEDLEERLDDRVCELQGNIDAAEHRSSCRCGGC